MEKNKRKEIDLVLLAVWTSTNTRCINNTVKR